MIEVGPFSRKCSMTHLNLKKKNFDMFWCQQTFTLIYNDFVMKFFDTCLNRREVGK